MRRIATLQCRYLMSVMYIYIHEFLKIPPLLISEVVMKEKIIDKNQCIRETVFPLVDVRMVGIDCTCEQFEKIALSWPVFSNSAAEHEHILDAMAFTDNDVKRLSWILGQDAKELKGAYILLVTPT